MVSQGSAATSLRYGGIYNANFVANFVLSLAVKEFWISINISRSYRHEQSVVFVLTHSVIFVENKRDINIAVSNGLYRLYTVVFLQTICNYKAGHDTSGWLNHNWKAKTSTAVRDSLIRKYC